MSNRKRYCWIGQRAVDCIGMHRYLQFDSIICCDYGHEVELIESKYKIKVFSLEKELGVRRIWSNFTIDEAVKCFESYFNDREITVLPYKVSEDIESLSKNTTGKIGIVAPPSSVVNLLDDKIYCADVFSKINVAYPKWGVHHKNDISFQNLISIYGDKFVMKKRRGASGHQTFIVASEKEFSEITENFQNEDILITAFVEGLSFNVHVVIDVTGKAFISAPSAQLIGIPESTTKKEVYCGNDFSVIRSLPSELVGNINQQARKIADWLFEEHNFVGIFGLDLIGTPDELIVLEINPRFQGSTPLLTQSEMLHNTYPTVMSMFRPNANIRKSYANASLLTGSQVILHSISEKEIEFREDLLSGVYEYIDNKISYLRPGITLLECLNENEFILTAGVPKKGIRVQPNSALVKIITPNSVLDVKTGMLNKRTSEIAQKMTEFFNSRVIV